MLEIFVYAFGIMYTPGPANLLSLNAGLKGQTGPTLRFCCGVACAMLMLFIVMGYSGSWLINPNYQLIISIAGCAYILYLALKITAGSIKQTKPATQDEPLGAVIDDKDKLSFKAGLFLQLLNPKAFIAIFPIVTVQFPAAQITGSSILLNSILLSCLAFGAPACYLMMGARFGRFAQRTNCFRYINLMMACLLFYTAADIFYHHVFKVVF